MKNTFGSCWWQFDVSEASSNHIMRIQQENFPPHFYGITFLNNKLKNTLKYTILCAKHESVIIYSISLVVI